MDIIPLGLTDISSEYIPFSSPPSVTGRDIEKLPFTPKSSEINVNYSNKIDNINFYPNDSLSITTETTYVRPGGQIVIDCKLSRDEIERPYVVLRLVRSLCSVYDLPDLAPYSLVNSSGLTEITLTLGRNTSVNCQLQFVAHLSESFVSPELFISTQEYDNLKVRSNLVTVNVLSEPNTVVEPPNPPAVSAVPLHELLLSLITNTTKGYITDNHLDLMATNPNPRGSSGLGIYSDLNLSSPFLSSLHSQKPSEGLSRLLGSTKTQLYKLGDWAEKVLKKTHKDSEINILSNLLPASIKQALNRYTSLLDESGKYASDIAASFTPDYAYGNSLFKSNAVEQHNVGQYRVQTASTFNIDSPSIHLSSQHSLYQSRFEHHNCDIFQISSQHGFVRSEDMLTSMSANTTRYTSNELSEYSKKSNFICEGESTVYSKSLWHQIGQANSPGNLVELVRGQSHHVSTGEYVINSGDNTILRSAKVLAINSDQGVYISSNSIANITTRQVLRLQGSIVQINCGGGTSGSIRPKVLTDAFKVFQAITEPKAYSKESVLPTSSIGQNGTNTPEPNYTIEGDYKLGRFLTNVE